MRTYTDTVEISWADTCFELEYEADVEIDNSYGADADGNRGIRGVFVDYTWEDPEILQHLSEAGKKSLEAAMLEHVEIAFEYYSQKLA